MWYWLASWSGEHQGAQWRGVGNFICETLQVLDVDVDIIREDEPTFVDYNAWNVGSEKKSTQKSYAFVQYVHATGSLAGLLLSDIGVVLCTPYGKQVRENLLILLPCRWRRTRRLR